nr:PREDICTED: actin-related protein 5 [Lepisosteus oculatus]
MAAPAAAKIFSFQDYRAVPDPVLEVSPECLQPSPVPIVIDNGSFQTRAGWAGAGDEFSAPRLQFKSVAARSRGAARSETQIGNDIPNLEPLRWLLKSQFDRNVVVNFEIQELMFDYIFMHLGIATEGCVEHPVVLTEAPCNPLHCRQMMSELLFECYGVPRVSYGVDSLYSFYYNNVQRSLSAPHTGIVISSGYHCSHILPVINGRAAGVRLTRTSTGHHCLTGRPWRGSGCSAVRDGALGPFRVVVVLVESCTSVLQTPELEQSMEEGDGVAELEPEFNEDQPEADKPANPAQPVFNLAEYHQLFVGTERLRVPEILFQPSVIGEEQMGVMETLQYILDRWHRRCAKRTPPNPGSGEDATQYRDNEPVASGAFSWIFVGQPVPQSPPPHSRLAGPAREE